MCLACLEYALDLVDSLLDPSWANHDSKIPWCSIVSDDRHRPENGGDSRLTSCSSDRGIDSQMDIVLGGFFSAVYF
jgi:hypothetical protein